MDFPLPKRKPTWRDSTWWQATEQSVISGVLMTAVAFPLVIYLIPRIMGIAHLDMDLHGIAREVAEGGLLMLPYLWLYFFALERIARHKHEDFSSSVHE
jgi:hypothetical protein